MLGHSALLLRQGNIMSTIPLSEIFESSEKRKVIAVKVLEELGRKTFLIADPTGEVTIEIQDSKPYQAKYLSFDKCIRIMNPVLDQENRKLIVGKGKFLVVVF